MSIKVNETDIGSSIKLNNTDLSEIIFNGNSIWKSKIELKSFPNTFSIPFNKLCAYNNELYLPICQDSADPNANSGNNYKCVKLTSNGWETVFYYSTNGAGYNFQDINIYGNKLIILHTYNETSEYYSMDSIIYNFSNKTITNGNIAYIANNYNDQKPFLIKDYVYYIATPNNIYLYRLDSLLSDKTQIAKLSANEVGYALGSPFYRNISIGNNRWGIMNTGNGSGYGDGRLLRSINYSGTESSFNVDAMKGAFSYSDYLYFNMFPHKDGSLLFFGPYLDRSNQTNKYAVYTRSGKYSEIPINRTVAFYSVPYIKFINKGCYYNDDYVWFDGDDNVFYILNNSLTSLSSIPLWEV